MELGLDISKRYFDATLLKGVGKKEYYQFENRAKGIESLLKWLKSHGVKELHACMEATNTYWEEVADALHQAGYDVSVVNPARIKGFAMGQMRRNKNDKLDSDVIVEFCAQMKPGLWTPLTASQRKMRNWVRHRDGLKKTLTQQRNRLANTQDGEVRASLQRIIDTLSDELAQLEERIDNFIDSDEELQTDKALIASIKGVGDATAHVFLSEMPDLARYQSASAAAADVGITPSHHESGDTVRHRPRISKMGKASVRGILYWPAITAMRCNPLIQAFAARLEARGKPKMVIIVAVMRKLVHLIYGVLKNRTPFDPNYGRQPLPT
jgi:transposase